MVHPGRIIGIFVSLIICAPCLAAPSIDFKTEPDAIGINSCPQSLSDAWTVAISPGGTVQTSSANADAGLVATVVPADAGVTGQQSGPYTIKLLFYTGTESACLEELNDGCPSFKSTEDSACGCLVERDSSDINSDFDHQVTFPDDENLKSLFCTGGASINFQARLVFTDGASDTETSEELNIAADLTAPTKPATPIVQAADNAISVTVDASEQATSEASGSVQDHEVCVRKKSATSDANTETSNSEDDAPSNDVTALRGGYSNCSPRTTKLKDGEDYRFEGLELNITYEVIVAAYDEAGNRSENSDSAEATPASLFDFAELYSNRVGEYKGEEGGCSNLGVNSNDAPLFGLLAIAGIWLAGRRRRCG